MSIILFAIVILLLVGLMVWAITFLVMIPDPIRMLLQALAILLGVVLIGQKAGLW